jgi:TP901 family phage tail tape measure protein
MGISQPTIKIKASLDEQSLATVRNRIIGECKNIERQSKIKVKLEVDKSGIKNSSIKVDTSSVKTAQKDIQNLKQEIDSANKSTIKPTVDTTTLTQTESALRRLTGSFNELLKLRASYSVISLFSSAIGQAKQSIMDFDSALTEYNKVTQLSSDGMEKQISKLKGYAKEVGRTTSEMIQGTTGWKKAGFTDEDASILSKVTALYQNTADEVMSTSQATDILTSIIKAYNIQASDSIQVTDKINKVSADFAVSSGDIGNGLKVASASMSTMGNSLDQTTALLTAGTTIFQHQSSQVARGLNTIGLNLTKNKAKLEQYGIATTDSNGKLRSTYDILNDLHDVWGRLGETQERADLGMTLAGKNQYKVLSAIMSQWDVAEKSLNESMNAQGETMKQNEVFMDSLQAKINTLKGTFETLVLSGGFGDLAKVVLDITTNTLSLINTLGGLKTILLGVASAVTIINAERIATNILKIRDSFNSIKAVIQNFGVGFKNIITSIKSIDDLKALGQQGASGIKAFFDTFKSGSASVQEQARSVAMAKEGFNALSVAEQEAVVQQEAMRIASTNLVTALGGVMAVLTVVMSLYSAYSQAQEEKSRQEEEDYQNSLKKMDSYNKSLVTLKDETSTREELIKAIGDTDIANKNELQSLSDTTEMRKKAIKEIERQQKAEYELNKAKIHDKLNVKAKGGSQQYGEFNQELGSDTVGIRLQNKIQNGNKRESKRATQISKGLYGSDITKQQRALASLIVEYNKLASSVGKNTKSGKEYSKIAKQLSNDYNKNDKAIKEAIKSGDKYGKFLDKNDKKQLKSMRNAQKDAQSILSGENKKVQAHKKSTKALSAEQARQKQLARDSKSSLDDLTKRYSKMYKVSKDSLSKNMGNIKALADKYGMTISEAMDMLGYSVDNANDKLENVEDNFNKLEQNFQNSVSSIGQLAQSYDALSDACSEYNEQGYLNLDTLSQLLEQSPEYLACLDIENGKMTINQDAYRALAEEKINQAEVNAYLEATAVLTGKAMEDEGKSAENTQSAHASAVSGMQNAESEVKNLISIVNQGTQAWNEYSRAASQGAVASGKVDQATADKTLNTLHTRLTMLESARKNLGKMTFSTKRNTGATKGNTKAHGGNAKARKGSTGATKRNTGANDKNTRSVNKNTDALKKRQKALQDEVQKYETVISYIKDKVSDYISELEKAKEKETDAIQKQIDDIAELAQQRDDYYSDEIEKLDELSQKEEDYYNNKIAQIQDVNDELDDEIQYQQLLDSLEKAKKTKVKVYHEGQGFVYDVDQSAVSEAQKELDEYKRKKESERRIKALETERDKKKAIYDQQIKDLEAQQKSEKANYDLQTKQLEQHKKDVEKHYDDIIAYWNNWNDQFQKQVDAYKDHQNALLAEQLTGINFENQNWQTRLNNLGGFVNNYRAKCAELEAITRQLNQATDDYERAQARASAVGGGGGGGSVGGGGGGGSAGGGGGSRNVSQAVSRATSNAVNSVTNGVAAIFSPIGRVYTWHGGTPYQRKEHGKWKNYKTENGNHGFKVTSQDSTYYYGTSHRGNYIRIKKNKVIATNRTNAYASGTPSVKENEVAIVGDSPNSELVIGSKLNGTPINLQKGSGVVNAKSTKTIAGLLNNLSNLSSNNISSNLTNNNQQSVIIENVTIDGAKIHDVNSFVNELQNIKGIALQRAYRKN